jgi:hypothetical protein
MRCLLFGHVYKCALAFRLLPDMDRRYGKQRSASICLEEITLV